MHFISHLTYYEVKPLYAIARSVYLSVVRHMSHVPCLSVQISHDTCHMSVFQSVCSPVCLSLGPWVLRPVYLYSLPIEFQQPLPYIPSLLEAQHNLPFIFHCTFTFAIRRTDVWDRQNSQN